MAGRAMDPHEAIARVRLLRATNRQHLVVGPIYLKVNVNKTHKNMEQ